jgi:hypothetical protein
MSVRCSILLTMSFLAPLAGTAYSQWVQTNGPYGGTVRAFAASGPNLLAGTDGGGIFRSTNNGTSWTQVNTGLTNTWVLSLAVSGTNLFAGTFGSSVWRRPLSEMTAVEGLPSELPAEFILQQNYPNPFNPSTRIRFSVRGSGFEGDGSGLVVQGSRLVTLKVYDVLGHEVATLVNEVLLPGSYEVTFDAAGLASGVYIYRLTAGEFTASRRMMLLR